MNQKTAVKSLYNFYICERHVRDILWRLDPLLNSDSKQRPLLSNARNIHARNNRTVFFFGVFRAEMLQPGGLELREFS
jgi:hypothetical protein